MGSMWPVNVEKTGDLPGRKSEIRSQKIPGQEPNPSLRALHGSVLVRRGTLLGTDCPAQTEAVQSFGAPTVRRRAPCRHLAPEAEIDHAPSGEPEDLGQPARELPDPVQ